jgi:thiol-disulfide isomerase/thioredoxin
MKNRVLSMPTALLLACGLVCGLGVGQSADDIVREGAGSRREQLNAAELKPVDASLFRGLTDWAGGKSVSLGDTSGKVVLVMTWSSWYPPANRMLPTAQRLATEYAGKGLIVVVAHPSQEWEEAKKAFGDAPANMFLAKDDGSLRSTLLVDQDPDFYLIDRAGQMRFADIDNRSVERAVEIAIKETAEQAASIPGSLASKAAQAEDERWRTRGLSREYVQALRGLEDLEFTMPEAAAYTAVKWPETKDDSGGYNSTTSLATLPATLDGWTWVTTRPSIQGKVVVLDFFRTWCGPCKRAIPGLEALQGQYKNELAIIAVSGPDGGSGGETEAKLRAFVGGKTPGYAYAWDGTNGLMNQMNVNAFPTVLVLSSDGTIRYRGNPLSPDFRKAVEGVIAVDPGVKARRAARAEHLKRLEAENER